jgi:hypothetical protein
MTRAVAHLCRAESHHVSGNDGEAITDYTKAIDSRLLRKKIEALAYCGRAESRRGVRDYQGATKDLTTAIDSKQLPPAIAAQVQRNLVVLRCLSGDALGAPLDRRAAETQTHWSPQNGAKLQFDPAGAPRSLSNNPLAKQNSRQLTLKRKADVQSGPPESRQRIGQPPGCQPSRRTAAEHGPVAYAAQNRGSAGARTRAAGADERARR